MFPLKIYKRVRYWNRTALISQNIILFNIKTLNNKKKLFQLYLIYFRQSNNKNIVFRIIKLEI